MKGDYGLRASCYYLSTEQLTWHQAKVRNNISIHIVKLGGLLGQVVASYRLNKTKLPDWWQHKGGCLIQVM